MLQLDPQTPVEQHHYEDLISKYQQTHRVFYLCLEADQEIIHTKLSTTTDSNKIIPTQ